MMTNLQAIGKTQKAHLRSTALWKRIILVAFGLLLMASYPVAAVEPANAVPIEKVFDQVLLDINRFSLHIDRWAIDEVPNLYDKEDLAEVCRNHLQLLHTYDQANLTVEQQVAYIAIEKLLTNGVNEAKYWGVQNLFANNYPYHPVNFIQVQTARIQTLTMPNGL